MRPTSDMVRSAIFNILGSLGVVEDATVLDLFAGAGGLGIEALSRGAASATFVEQDPVAVQVIRENLHTTGLAGGTVVRDDVLRYLAKHQPAGAAAVDIAFADPPYTFDSWERLLALLERVTTLAALESDRTITPGDAWEVLKSKRYGSTVVTLIAPRPTSPKGLR